MKLYAIRDIKAGFNAPFNQVNEEIAKRTFTDLCNDKTTTVGKFKEDFELWEVGTMDEENGEINSKPCYIVGGRDFV